MTLQEKYRQEILPGLAKLLKHKSVMACPRVMKVVVNSGFGKMITQDKSERSPKIIEEIVRDLTLICGQKAAVIAAKKSIAAFKLRQGQTVGAKITLRGRKMFGFLERAIRIALPRSRDFQGLEQSAVDKAGNLTFAIKEQTVFPEVPIEKSTMTFGLEATVVLNSASREDALKLYELLGFPFKKA